MLRPGTTVAARRAFLERLIDDAGLFPPASLKLPEALALDESARQGPHSWMLGRFVAPVAQLRELAATVPSVLGTLPVSAIVDGGHVARDIANALEASAQGGGAIHIASIEVRLPDRPDGDMPTTVTRIVAEIDAGGLPRSAGVYLECAFGADWRSHLMTTFGALADARARSPHRIAAKLRCGGVRADAVPSVEQLAFAVGMLRALGVPLKATAGLHHPVRGRQSPGFVMHGFLNVIGVAVLDYELDLDERTRGAVLAETSAAAFRLDDDEFAWRDVRLSGAQIARARAEFIHSYGSCSFYEPVTDLQALGMLT